MKCPRCKTICEEEDALYCLVCGKKLRRDDGFDGEFQEEFRFDEEIEAENRALEERKKLLSRERLRTALLLASLCLLIAAVCALFFFLLRPTDTPNPQEDEQIESEGNGTNEETQLAIEEFVSALFTASCQTYDLDTILAGTPKELVDYLLQELLTAHECETKEELYTVFSKLGESNPLTVTDLSVTVSDALTPEELDEKLGTLQTRTGIALPTPSAAYLADLVCFAMHGEDKIPTVTCYLVLEYENQYFATAHTIQH